MHGFRRATFALIVSCFAQDVALHAQPRGRIEQAVSRESVYSAMILNLARFVRWPENAFASPDAPLVIGTLSRDPINGTLDRFVQHERVEEHPVQTRRIRSAQDLAGCHVVFFSSNQSQAARSVLTLMRGTPVLTISDSDGALELGAHVALLSSGQRTRIRIHVSNLGASGLVAKSQLLRLAELTGE